MSNFLTGTSNAEYHADTTHLSSSGLKLLLKDPARFYKEYVLGEREEKDSPALVEGTLVHAMILEPHTVDKLFIEYPGARRAGKAYEAWLAENDVNGRTVITSAQFKRCAQIASACLNDIRAMDLLDLGIAEDSMLATLHGVPVKARADYRTNTYIVDVKTSSKPTGEIHFAATIETFDYDLSAALYCDIAGLEHFYWIVISKADLGVTIVKANALHLKTGREKYRKAIEIYKHCKQTGVWALPEAKKEDTMSNTFKTKKGNELPLINLKGKPYLQVAHRFVALNDETNRFVIRTEFPVLNDEQTVCTATVMVCSDIGEVLRQATGTKRETKKDFGDHTEKAETGAIGRALAMLGFGTQFAVQDIGDEGERLADAPVIPAKKTTKNVSNIKPAASGEDF